MKEILFGDRVKIKAGFYGGCKGIVVDFTTINGARYFTVEISKLDGANWLREKVIQVPEDNLELLKK